MSINSPSFVPVFGSLMWRRKLLSSFLNLTQFQVRVDELSNDCSFCDSSSPILVEPKKAIKAAVHKVCFVSWDQPEMFILWPRCLSMGIETTLLVLEGGEGEDMRRLAAPFRTESKMLSFNSKDVKPLNL